MMLRLIFLSLAALLLAACDETDTSADAPSGFQADRMVRLIEASPTFSAVPPQCPLSVYKSKPAISAAAPDCDRQPGQCLSQCEAGNASACFDAARLVERANIIDDSHLTYPLFMAACALGAPNACVNAGATVKNGGWSKQRPKAAGTAQCQFTTYDRMCKDGAAWGCYMVAGEYRRSDGHRPRNADRADANLRRACELDADSGACLPDYR